MADIGLVPEGHVCTCHHAEGWWPEMEMARHH